MLSKLFMHLLDLTSEEKPDFFILADVPQQTHDWNFFKHFSPYISKSCKQLKAEYRCQPPFVYKHSQNSSQTHCNIPLSLSFYNKPKPLRQQQSKTVLVAHGVLIV